MVTRKKDEFRIDLRDEYVDYYHNIKVRNSISSNVDVFRHALEVTEQYERGEAEDTIHPQLHDVMERWLIRPDVQAKFSISSREELLRLAVARLLDEIEEFVKTRSLVHWDVRTSLQGRQRKVAIAFKELHLESPDGTVSRRDLLNKLSWSDPEELDQIMNEFVYQSLVTKEELGNQMIYHAPW